MTEGNPIRISVQQGFDDPSVPPEQALMTQVTKLCQLQKTEISPRGDLSYTLIAWIRQLRTNHCILTAVIALSAVSVKSICCEEEVWR